MQNVNESKDQLLMAAQGGELLTAQQLLDLTATEQELTERRIEEYKSNFMSTMVKQATDSGKKAFGAHFIKEPVMTVMETIAKDFKSAGYEVSTTESIQNVPGANGQTTETPIVTLLISWEKANQTSQVCDKGE